MAPIFKWLTITNHSNQYAEKKNSSEKKPFPFILYEVITTILENLSPSDFIPENLQSITLFVLAYLSVRLWISLSTPKVVEC